ncbi:hypothetical protein OKW41_003514 [Paraburkholderia sp. UCT70]
MAVARPNWLSQPQRPDWSARVTQPSHGAGYNDAAGRSRLGSDHLRWSSSSDRCGSQVRVGGFESRRSGAASGERYGVPGNEAVLNAFLRYHHTQGLSERLMTIDELFAPSTTAQFVI